MSTAPAQKDPDAWDMNAHFEKAAAGYEKSGGNFTRKISAHLIEVSQPPLSPSAVVLDNACGPGITCTEILARVPKDQWPGAIHATDFSPAMIRELDKKGHKEIQGAAMDAQELKFPDQMFTHVYFAFAIFALPDAKKGASEVYRVLKPGGSAYVTTWKGEIGWVPMVDRAIHAVRPDAPEYTGPLDVAWRHAEKLKEVLVSGGFEEGNVDVHDLEGSMGSDTMEGMLEFMTSGVLAPATKGWSEEEKAKLYEGVTVEIKALKTNHERVHMPAWIAVARK